MIATLRRAWLIGLFLPLLLTAPARAQEEAPREPLRLTILHTNDIHGQVLQPAGRGGQPAPAAGLVALGRAIRQERDRAAREGEHVLLLDAGDVYKGTPEGDLTDGGVVVAWMNHMGYDAAAIGNHEFDHGLKVVEQLARQARFPWLGANVREEATGLVPAWLGEDELHPLRGQVLLRTYEAGGARATVAVIGLTTSAMKLMTLTGLTDGYAFDDEAQALERVLQALPPVDLVVVLTHSGLSTDVRLAQRFAGRVHVIVGGHSHTRLHEGKRVGGVLVTQAGSHAWWLGRIRARIAPPGASGPRVHAEATLLPAGDDLEGVMAPYVEQVQEKVGARIGELTVDLDRVSGYASSRLGNLQTDLMREATGAQVAFQNKTGIRADLRAGPVALRDVYMVSPFGNTVVSMKLKGRDLRELVEGMLAAPHRLLEVSGARVVCDPARPAGERLLELTVGGAPLDLEATYVVATNNFLAGGGDGHEAFTRGADALDTTILMRDLLRRRLEERSPYDPGPLEPRLVTRP